MPPLYRATQNEDGTFNIHDVPIFGALPKRLIEELEEKEDHRAAMFRVINKAWLEAVIENHAARNKEGYLPPLHFHHHEFGDNTTRVGHFLPTHVGKARVDGVMLTTLFAVLLKIPEDRFKLIQEGEYPYRSPEIFEVSKQRINHLALLDDQEPFFMYPLLNGDTIGSVEPLPEELKVFGGSIERGSARMTRRGDLSFITSKRGAIALFRFKEEPMSGLSIKVKDGKILWLRDGAAIDTPLSESVSFQEDDDKKDKDSDELKAALALIKKLKARLKKFEDDDDDDDDKEKDLGVHGDDDDDDEKEKAEKAKKAKAKKARRLQDATIAGLETRIDKMEEAQTTGASFDKALALLEPRYRLSDKNKDRLRAACARGEQDDWVEMFKSSVTPEPRKHGDMGGDLDLDSDPPEVAKYGQNSPDQLEAARASAKQYFDLKANGVPIKCSLEDHLRTHVPEAAAV